MFICQGVNNHPIANKLGTFRIKVGTHAQIMIFITKRLRKLSDTIDPRSDDARGELPAADEANNADAFAELIQCLDDRSLSLIMREARDDGRKALGILREHYLGRSKPRIIGLYHALCSLNMNNETTTDSPGRASGSCIKSSDGVQHEIMLSDALYVPSYKQSIFSVRAAVKKGVSVNFCPYKCEMKVEGTTFDIQERGKLYYGRKEGRKEGRNLFIRYKYKT